MSLNKKIFIASSVFFLIIVLFWGIYNLSFKKEISHNLSSEKNSSSLLKKIIPTQKNVISLISKDSLLDPILNKDGVTITYYAKNDEKIYQIDLDGNNKKELSNNSLKQLYKLAWSPEKDRVLFGFKNGHFLKFGFFNYLSKRGGELNQQIINATWQNEQKIIYVFYDSTKKSSSLNVADWDGKNWQKLTTLDYENQKIKPVPHSGLISFWNRPHASYKSNFYSIPLIGGEKKLILNSFWGADYLWSPSGNRILISHVKEKNGKRLFLGITDFQGKHYQDLNLPTLISKCVWSKDSKTIFCALPGSIPSNSLLPNDYEEKKFFTTDTFWKINVETGERERLLDLDAIKEKYDAQNLFFNQDESMLFFVNRYDNKLYRINL
jgi:hypothetical protein